MHEKGASDSVGTKEQPKSEKQYVGKRSYGQCFVTIDGRALDPRFDLRFHSPDGFEWGYGGSGSAQLALALLADWLGDDAEALRVYQEFKSRAVAGLPREGWTLTGAQIREELRTLGREERT
jgi:hypothetical protein